MEPEDREAVLMQWERKIEQAERGGRFDRDDETPKVASPSPRFERSAPAPHVEPAAAFMPVTTGAPVAERRTITITGQPTPARRRASLAERHLAAQPDRIALWAFLLGLLLIAVAAGTAHA